MFAPSPIYGNSVAPRRLLRIRTTLTIVAAAVTLAGCGGAERAPPVVVAPPPPPPPSPQLSRISIPQDDPEYLRSNAAVSSRALVAWNAGATGRGINVAVIDSGINPDLAEFAGRIHAASRDVASNRGVIDNDGHGTAVSGVIAAARNGSGPMGVAFESTIMSFNTANPDNCEEGEGCKHSDTAIGQAIDLARLNGARVINISLGGDGVGDSVLTAANRAAQQGIIVVISAGNDGKADPSKFALKTANDAGAGHVIIAGSLGVPIDGDPTLGTDLSKLSTFSNAAGTGAKHYLAALGYRVRTFDETGTGFLYSGTSFSAPVISGAAALLAQAFPNLTGRQIIEILFSTSDDLGDPGVDSVFGHGRLNIERAFQPQGKTTAAGSGVEISTSGNGSASGAMGDVGGQSFGAIILDGYARAYVLDLAQTLSRAAQERPLARGLQTGVSTGYAVAGRAAVSLTVRQVHAGLPEVSLSQTGMTFEDSRLARAVAGHAIAQLSEDTAVALGFSESGRTLGQRLNGDGGTAFLVAVDPMSRTGFDAAANDAIAVRHDLGSVALTATAEAGAVNFDDLSPQFDQEADRSRYSFFSLNGERKIGASKLRFGVSQLTEERTVLGGRFSFAPGGSTSWFFDVIAGHELGSGWSAQAQYRFGETLMPGGNGLTEGGRLSTNAWSLDLMKVGAFSSRDRLAFRVMQPLRVSSGGYFINLPISYDYSDRSVGYRLSELNLAPRGQEIAFEAAYGIDVFDGAGRLSANAFLRRDPGHVEERKDDLGAAVRVILKF